MLSYFVYLRDGEGHTTRCHKIDAASDEAIVRKAASLYCSRPVVEIRAGDRVVAHLTAEEMAEIDGRRGRRFR